MLTEVLQATPISCPPPKTAAPDVRSLAALKRFFAEPGATAQKIAQDGITSPSTMKPELWAPRRIEHLQTNAVRFEGGSWLYLEKGSKIRCEGDRFSVCCSGSDEAPFTRVMTYVLSLGEPLPGQRGGMAGTRGTDRRK